MASEKRLDRRKMLLWTLGGVTSVTGGVLGYDYLETRKKRSLVAPAIEDRPGIVDPNDVVTERRRLGKTGLEVSVVSIGAGGINEAAPIARAVDKGINYVDTSICYGESEEVLRRAFEGWKGLRQKLIVATKWDAGRAMKKAEILASLEKSLRRLGTDVIDIMQIHWLGGGHVRPDSGFDRLDNEELYLAMDEAKKSGKVRFFGATSHDGNRSKILMHAIDKGFDMILVKMNVLDFESAGIPELLAHAKKHDVGVVAMKSQPSGGRVPKGMENSRWSIYQANLRWCLEQEGVHTVVHSAIGGDAHAQDLAASATKAKLGAKERLLLEQYASALSPAYCRECEAGCVEACPAGVAIPHVMHLAMYDREYRWHEYAKHLHDEMPERDRWSATCVSCNKCTDACPYGVDAAEGMRHVRRSLG